MTAREWIAGRRSMIASDPHIGCPDNWPHCTHARTSLPLALDALEVAIEALEKITRPRHHGERSSAIDALARIEGMVTPSARDREMAMSLCVSLCAVDGCAYKNLSFATADTIATALAQARYEGFMEQQEPILRLTAQARAEERERAIGIVEYSVDSVVGREKAIARIRDDNFGQHTNRARAAEGL